MKFEASIIQPKKSNSRKLRNYLRTGEGMLLGGGVFVLLLAVWEISARFNVINPIFSSSPSRIVTSAIEIVKEGSLWGNFLASSKIFVIGFLMAILVGVPAGLILGWSRRVNQAFGPLIAALYAIPDLALMPLFIVWFGLGLGSKVVLIFLNAVFPIIMNIQMAMRSIDNDLVKVSRSYGASQGQIFRTIALPISVPFIMTGLQIASTRALIGVVGAEVFGAQEGIGYMIRYAGMNFQTDKVFVYVIIITLMAIIMDRSLHALTRKFDSWRGLD